VNYIAYGKLPLILLSRSADSKQIEWVPPAPPLYKKRQVRAQVFGFPVTHDDLRVWAEKHNTRPEAEAYLRRHAARKAICSRLPRNHRRITLIHNPMATYLQSMCIVVGTNFNAKDMEITQDAELVKSLYDAIDMGNPPGWFYMSRG
jgi:hypothetical protein